MSRIFSRVAIVGVGLIGGSLGMAIKKGELATAVIGVDVSPDTLELAQQLQAIDEGTTDLATGVSQADLVVLAVPLGHNEAILTELQPHLPATTLLTDVGSCKGRVVREVRAILGDQSFVGGHPMAGSEVAGVRGADPYLFENAIYVLTPTEETDPQALERMQRLVVGVGGKVVELDPDDHDLMVAAISHLPHLVASTLVNAVSAVEELHPDTLMLAAGGFRDTTRIAGGSPGLWRDICFSNRERLLQLTAAFRETLGEFEGLLKTDNDQGFYQALAQAKQTRSRVPVKLKGYWPMLEEVIVTIPDKPGMIGRVAVLLGTEGINIDDIEILRVREGEGGSLRLGFATSGVSEKAVSLLRGQGFIARIKG